MRAREALSPSRALMGVMSSPPLKKLRSRRAKERAPPRERQRIMRAPSPLFLFIRNLEGKTQLADYRKRFEQILGELPESNDLGELSVLCPFHEDHKRSASVNLKTGLFFCMACESSHNFLTFKQAHKAEHGAPDKSAPGTSGQKFVSEQIVREMHLALLNQQVLLRRLQDERGIGIKTLRKYQIGFHSRTNRIAIPIMDKEGVCRNVRLYSFLEKGQQKMLSWQQGFGAARLWPLENLGSGKYVFLAEGEMDRLILAENGLNSVTSTGGAKTWKSEWSAEFEDMKVFIVYDADQAGDEGARKAAASISSYARQVKIVRLELSQSEDITDFFVSYGFGVSDLKQVVKKAPKFKRPLSKEDVTASKAEWTTLGLSLNPRFRKREIMMPVIVSARRDERLHYPTETVFSCDQIGRASCRERV